MKISLREITPKNFKQCLELSVAPEQESFVATNVQSIAQAKVYPTAVPLAVYHEEEMVGFVMHAFDTDEQRFYLTRLMIDQKHQGKGYGKAVTLEVIGRLSENPDCDEIYLCCSPENIVAKKLYEKLGFFETGELYGKEVVMKFIVKKHSA